MNLAPDQAAELDSRFGRGTSDRVQALNASRAVEVRDDEMMRPEVAPPDEEALERVVGETQASDVLRWPETTAWQEAEVIRWWYALGVPWLAAAERGDGEATVTLPVVGYDVTTRLILGPVEELEDGTVASHAAYRWTGTEARDLEAVMLRQLRESGEEVAASEMEIDIEGVFWATYDAATRRPLLCRHRYSTTHRDPSSGTEMTTESEQRWTFQWPEKGDAD